MWSFVFRSILLHVLQVFIVFLTVYFFKVLIHQDLASVGRMNLLLTSFMLNNHSGHDFTLKCISKLLAKIYLFIYFKDS